MALPLNAMYLHLSTQVHVCIFSKTPKAKVCLRWIISKPETLFQNPEHDKIMFCNCKRILVNQHNHENHFRATVQEENDSKTAFCSIIAVPEAENWTFWLGSYSPVIQALYLIWAQRGTSSLSEKQTRTNLFNTSVMTWLQRDPTVQSTQAQWQVLHFGSQKHKKWIGQGAGDESAWK